MNLCLARLKLYGGNYRDSDLLGYNDTSIGKSKGASDEIAVSVFRVQVVQDSSVIMEAVVCSGTLITMYQST
jgi:hypothetical protein